MILGHYCEITAPVDQDHGVLGRPSRAVPISMIDGVQFIGVDVQDNTASAEA